MERNDADRATPAQFAAWLRDQLQHAGYDLRPRGGGQGRFAADSGIGAGTVSRMLTGQGATETRVLQAVADALRVPLTTVLVEAGVLTRRELEALRGGAPAHPLTPDQAADELGIHDEQARALFISMTRTLQQQKAQNGAPRSAEN
ncbi:helix-turn-helix domain-containing protein [Streptomyces sp. enrichment culture]|uniref:helix-turn-helix domain-containing protein n=1 Tax=Streptomyces sp. enrichment culture TaxID=1795815 RepID=UPI003F57AC42